MLEAFRSFWKNVKKFQRNYVKKKMVHIIGSDSHGLGKELFVLKESILFAQKIVKYDISYLY